jgi:Pentapeptide repeats (8 copies)
LARNEGEPTGNPEHIQRLKTMTRDAWNHWRESENAPDLRGCDLSGIDLSGFDLNRAILAEAACIKTRFEGASLAVADLISSNMIGVSFEGAYMEEALLGEAVLCGANFRKADLTSANLIYADLTGADLRGTDLGMARLADAVLDGAILSEANLWETQRADWSIRGVVCEAVFWDGEGKERTVYAPGEFERLHGTFPKIHLTYKGEMTVVDVLALPVFMRSLEERYPSCHFVIRSVGEAPGGAQASIAILDSGGLPAEIVAANAQRMLTAMAESFRSSNAELVRNLSGIIHRLIEDRVSTGRQIPAVNVGQLSVGAGATVQLAGGNASITDQEHLDASERNQLAELVHELRLALAERDRSTPLGAFSQVSTLIAIAEDEAAKDKPSKKAVLEVLKSLRNITEGAIGSLLASATQEKLFTLLRILMGG